MSTRFGLALLAALSVSLPLGAQSVGLAPLVVLNGEADERLRLAQLAGGTSSAGFLIRTASTLTPLESAAGSWTMFVLTPVARATRNSGLPYSLNDGPLWAGRGWSEDVTAGVAIRAPHFRLLAAPTFVSADNEVFQVIPYPQTGSAPRSVWANPFHPLPESIDLPLRFGERRRQLLDPGQSSAIVDYGGAAVGFATENEWWGPGIRNAITLSNNAPGFQHAFLGTSHPITTRAGTFNAKWIVGQLAESPYFDGDTTNNRRSMSGVVATWTPPLDSGLSLGVARLVMSQQVGKGFPVAAAFDVLRTVGHADVDTLSPVTPPGRDQVFSAFARWVFPGAGFEMYAEWARFEEPRSFRDFLEYPEHSQGYTLGLQWAHSLAAERRFRLQSEITYLEPDPSLRLRPTAITYTSRAVPQGFTQRGQMLGAAIGPGASSQWLAGDVFASRWRVGAYVNRIRWDNGVLFEPIVPQFKRQDVTMQAGLRGSVTMHGANLLVDFGHATRFNYLFQAYTLDAFGRTGGIDLINNTLTVTLSGMPPGLR